MDEDIFSFANLTNASFLEDLYQLYQKDPKNVDPTWRYFFSGMEFSPKEGPSSLSKGGQELSVFLLIQAYRTHGHKKASCNSMAEKKENIKLLELSSFGLKDQDLDTHFSTFGLLKEKTAPLSQIINYLEKIYCGTVGYEFMGIGSEVESWMISEIEGKERVLSSEVKKKILRDLNSAEIFEDFIHTKYPGQTRFSLEGAESFIPLLNHIIETAAEHEVQDIFIGMSHRGRLNLLAHVLNKSYLQIFHEFEDTVEELERSGDVKYHKGAHANLKTTSGHFIEVALAPNPSHLESVDPVVEGQVRAKQDLKSSQKTVVPILVHGDAALAGQGVVYEVLQMGSLKGYTTGGTIHVVVNNHIGYTTLPKNSRSTLYCTDIAKTFGAPVFHVNAEDPESCIMVAELAMKFRQSFHVDVFIDLNGYRKHGHNEGDEPTFTQPVEYKKIKEKKTIRQLFKEKLLQEGVLTKELVEKEEESIKTHLAESLASVLSQKIALEKKEKKPKQVNSQKEVPLLTEESLQSLVKGFCKVPEGFHIHPKLQRLVQERLKMDKIDWGLAEHLVFASLVFEKIHVRLSGQDVERGTFSHRHSIWIDQETSEKYSPLNHVSPDQAAFTVYNSLLSEFAVMGFDLGYSLSYPNSLVLWEAQFGDFVNGSQVIIDQYLATAEQKWERRSNLTLLLPHGYEGKGPEHSSAKIERFLQLCAEDNLILANCTTPAQFYHLLRRQAYLSVKRPLVVFTPKVLLRHPSCISSLRDFTIGCFQEVLDDPSPPINPTRVIFCSGKVFYDLLLEREKRGGEPALILRLEQLYPFPGEGILKILQSYPLIKKISWIQEEPKNMGAWTYMQIKLQELLKLIPRYVGREESASPATGSYALHKKQYEKFMKEAFQDEEVDV